MEVVKTSKTRREAADRLGYSNPSALYYHFKKFGIPPSPFKSREWASHFEDVVKNSKTRIEAAKILGYKDTGTVWHHMKRLRIESPPQWSRRPDARITMQRHIPETVIATTLGRRWVAGLVQGEACIQSIYRRVTDTTYLELDTAMVDPAPISKLSEYYGLPPPQEPIKNHDWNLQWRKNIQGLRALRVLQEISPFLVGQKLREAERALSFFSPFGTHPGCHRNGDIWPRVEFPLRTKGRGSDHLVSPGTDAELPPSLSPDNASALVALPRFAPPGTMVPDSDEYGPNQRKVPEIVIESKDDRAWVAALHQGEGATQSHYVRRSDSTSINITLGMTDFAPVFKFSQIVGLTVPALPRVRADPRLKPVWRKESTGLRAYRVLQEILPFMVGEKSREVRKALDFFRPLGTRQGHFVPAEIWPAEEFPLRARLTRVLGKSS